MTTVAQRLLIAGVAAAITLGGASVLVMPDDEHAARDKPEQQTSGGPVVGQTEVVATLPKPGHDGNGIADGEAQSGKGLSIAAGPDGTLYVRMPTAGGSARSTPTARSGRCSMQASPTSTARSARQSPHPVTERSTSAPNFTAGKACAWPIDTAT
ncbi:MAG: hypothetical protein DIU77_005875 [Thermocrispum agreste]|uniref:Uncharacterized protein n=1 Tax=Thermocrispum agreste TaxID=37925 RepID=A0ABD6FCH8_9PSEU